MPSETARGTCQACLDPCCRVDCLLGGAVYCRITKVARSVQEIAQLMQDLSGLVIDQGTKFDRIDYNIEQTVEDTEEAFKQLSKAEQSQKKSRLMNCIMLLLVMCAVMVALLFLKVIV